MTVETLIMDRNIQVLPMEYTSPFTRDRHARVGYDAQCSTQPVETPNATYAQAVLLVPAGYRMSTLDEIAYLMQREVQLKGEGKSPREALKDPLFARQIEGNPYRWNWTHVALRAPEGKDVFPFDIINGRKYRIADYVIGDKVVAQDVRVPVSQGGKVVIVDPVLRIPVEVSNGNEPQHTMHWYFDPENYDEKKEVAVRLGGGWSRDGHVGCLSLVASFGRSLVLSDASFRGFQGSLDEVPPLQVEYYVKDRESYDKGVRDGIRQERERVTRELVQERYHE